MKRLLAAGEVKDFLNLSSTDQVYRLVREGILPAVRIGRQIRFDPDVLQEWIKRGGKAYDGGWRKEA